MLRPFAWLEYAKGTVEGTVFEGEPWTDDLFEAPDEETAKAVLRSRFGNRVWLKNYDLIVDDGDVTWDERHGLAAICSFYLKYNTNLEVTEDMMKGYNGTWEYIWNDGKKVSFLARLTANGRMFLMDFVPPDYPDSDPDYPVCVFERDGTLVAPFKVFNSWQEVLDYSHEM